MATTVTEPKEVGEEFIPFYPDHVRKEAWVVVGLLVLAGAISALGLISPVGLGAPADPMDTPAHIKPEWYFLAFYQALKWTPKDVGVLIPLALLLVVAVWPFLDRRPRPGTRGRWIRAAIVLAGTALAAALTFWGAWS
jgi:ubiquinol-cytochrome c reductase cytochrome b subunit